MNAPELLTLLGKFSQGELRVDAARDLAAYLGVESILFFVRDPELDVLLPAPGFPQSFPNDHAWRTFTAACNVPGDHHTELPSPLDGRFKRAQLIVTRDRGAMALVGGPPRSRALAEFLPALPLLTSLMAAEIVAYFAAGEASLARNEARRARALANAVDAARREAERALAEALGDARSANTG